MANNPFDNYNDSEYTPRSPNLNPSTFDNYEPEPLHPQHQVFRGSVSHVSPFSPTGGSHDYFGRGFQTQNPYATPVHHQQFDMVKADPDDEEYGAKRGRGRGKKMKVEDDEDEEVTPQASGGGIEVKTKFPVARIKRIMQADEDVGKVAQVTPVAVSKALELFMIALITKSAAEAKTRNSKRVLPGHLKAAVTADEQFDFLNEIVAKVSDVTAAAGKSQAEDSDEVEVKVGKKRGRRRKVDADS